MCPLSPILPDQKFLERETAIKKKSERSQITGDISGDTEKMHPAERGKK
jgi:hypothetical protein